MLSTFFLFFAYTNENVNKVSNSLVAYKTEAQAFKYMFGKLTVENLV